jgi:hypothetical protein
MNRVYTVKVSHHRSVRDPVFQVVAKTPGQAIAKAKAAAARETGYTGRWVLEELTHLGRAI